MQSAAGTAEIARARPRGKSWYCCRRLLCACVAGEEASGFGTLSGEVSVAGLERLSVTVKSNHRLSAIRGVIVSSKNRLEMVLALKNGRRNVYHVLARDALIEAMKARLASLNVGEVAFPIALRQALPHKAKLGKTQSVLSRLECVSSQRPPLRARPKAGESLRVAFCWKGLRR